MNYDKLKDGSIQLPSNKSELRRKYKKSAFCSIFLVFVSIVFFFYLLLAFNFYLKNNSETVKLFDGRVNLFIKLSKSKPEVDIKFENKNFEIKHVLPYTKSANTCKDTSKSLFDQISEFCKSEKIQYSSLKLHDLYYYKNKDNFDIVIKKIGNTTKQKHHHIKDNSVECFSVNITNLNLDSGSNGVIGCFDLGNGYWYGGHESYDQPYWPINNQSFDYRAYITGFPDEWGALLERYWLSSNGIAIFVSEDVPLFVKHSSNNQICLMADRDQSPYLYTPNVFPNQELKYEICTGPDIKTLHLYMIDNYLGRPENAPDPRMMQQPVWTTWSYYFKDINQSLVLDYAQQIVSNNYSRSQLEIDDKWELHYGDLDFDTNKFPDMKSLSTALHNLDFRVTLWVHPFCNIDSSCFVNGTNNGYWVKDPTGNSPAFTSWWNGKYSTIIDTTNSNAVDYFTNKLNYLKQAYLVDAFKFDAGESSWVPSQFSYADKSANPNTYSRNYVKMASKFGQFIEVRAGAHTQNVGVFYRILDRATDWTIHDGLKSVVTETLQFGILGYPYVLPDIIFGNNGPDKSQKELFIRWTQVSAFLPSMQFSTPPWFYDDQTNTICRQMVVLHEHVLSPYMIQLAQRLDGVPIIRPMWWLDPYDIQTYTINDQFMIGDDVVVAPILDPGITSRNIYLPNGQWQIENGTIFKGPMWLNNYPVVLETIPYFISITSSMLSKL